MYLIASFQRIPIFQEGGFYVSALDMTHAERNFNTLIAWMKEALSIPPVINIVDDYLIGEYAYRSNTENLLN